MTSNHQTSAEVATDENSLSSNNIKLPWNNTLSLLFCGIHDPESPLHILLGHESTLLRSIYEFLVHMWLSGITIGIPARNVPIIPAHDYCNYSEAKSKSKYHPVAFAQCSNVKFPKPQGQNVNMMPFVLGQKESLPDSLKPYHERIIERCPYDSDDEGKVAYLTVMEGYVEEGTTQRRPGLHIEAPGPGANEMMAMKNEKDSYLDIESDKSDENEYEFENETEDDLGGFFVPAVEFHWGMGSFEDSKFVGGIFMASTISNSCRIYNALIDKRSGIVDCHGGCEHLRPLIGEERCLRAGELVWLTDRTPHESIPIARGQYRQFFRLVTSKISVWYSAHSTPNPNVPVPDDVLIIPDNKFKPTENHNPPIKT